MSAGAADRFACFRGKVDINELGQGSRSPDHGAETAGPQEVIANAVPLGEARSTCKIHLGVKEIDCGCSRSVVHIERAPGQFLVQIPSPPGGDAARRSPDDRLQLGFRDGLEDPPKDQEVNALVPESEGEVVCERVAWPIAFVKNFPGTLFPAAAANMLFGNGGG